MWDRADMQGSRSVYPVLTVFITLITNTIASECLTDAWKYDVTHSRCVMISDRESDYNSAVHQCGLGGGGLASPETKADISSLEELFGRKLESLTFWSEHLLVRQNTEYSVFNGRGVQVALSSCPQCSSLILQVPPSGVPEGSHVCAHVRKNASLTWTISNCSEQHYFMCDYKLPHKEDSPLAPRDIAAIAAGAFILVCFFVTLAIDFYLHVKRQKGKYLEKNRVTTVGELDQSDKKPTPLDFSVSNFGSNVELIPPNVTLSHV